MSSQAPRNPIVGFYGMLCVWAAWVSVCGAVLSPNGTIFEDNCRKTTTCEALKYNTCLGSPLPYTHTSLILAEDSSTQEEAFEKLTMWSGKFLIIQINFICEKKPTGCLLTRWNKVGLCYIWLNGALK